jgi:hypothetical protein
VFLLLASGNLCAGDDDNAAVHYRKAFALIPEMSAADGGLIFDPLKVPLDEKALDLLKRCEPALEQMRRGTSARRCDWGLDLSRKGFDERSDAQFKASKLGRVSCLKTRYLFEQKQAAAALEQFSDSVVLARHIGKDGPYISFLVEVALETVAVDVVAGALPQQSAETLKALTARLDALPRATLLSEAVRKEKDFYLQYLRPSIAELKTPQELRAAVKGWSAPDDEVNIIMKAAGDSVPGLLNLIDDEAERCVELSKIADLSPTEFPDGLARFEKKYPATNPVNKDLVPRLQQFRWIRARREARLAMLRAAIVLQQEGMEKFKAIKDPYGDGPFVYRPLKGGFELRSAVPRPFKEMPPAILTVGRPTNE